MKYALGKTPARADAVTLKFGMFFDKVALPTPPVRFGHELIGHQWGTLGNDRVGDCVFAGAAHEHMVWSHMGTRGPGVDFTTSNVLSDYSALTGYNGTRGSDVGSDMSDAANYRRMIGIIDNKGKRHKIDAYVALTPGHADDLALATYLTGAAAVGLRLPDSTEKQFDRKVPWDVVPHAKIRGGHYVPCIGRNSAGNYIIITWGREQAMTPAFYSEYCDEALGYLSIEILREQLSPEGFAADDLLKALRRFSA
jgi:hypothetical protein